MILQPVTLVVVVVIVVSVVCSCYLYPRYASYGVYVHDEAKVTTDNNFV